MSSSFPSPYSSFPSLWYKLILVSSVHRMLFQNCEGFFRCRLANSNLAFLFWGSPMVYILWWTLCIHSGEVFSWLLTLTHIHLPPGECSWSGQLLWRVFLHQGKNSSVIHHSCFPWVFRVFWCLLSSPVRSFFLRMFQTVVLATPNVLLSLWWVLFVFSA